MDPQTWEIADIAFRKPWYNGKYIQPSYSQRAIDTVRLVTSPLWENTLCHITKGRRVKRWNNRGYDINLPTGAKMEAKVGRIWNSAVIKRNQLDDLSDQDFYWLVYYRTTGNKPPSFFTSQETQIWPIANLKRNISIQAAFIFPQPLMVYYYNESDVVEWKISTTWIHHKPIAFSRAMDLFESDVSNFSKQVLDVLYGRHTVKVYTVGYDL